MGHNYIGTERILLALLVGTPIDALTAAGVTKPATEADVIAQLATLTESRRAVTGALAATP